jgi:hypothetical protein
VIRVDPALIRFKISPHHDLRGDKGGDWDSKRRFRLSEAVKHRSIRQRYVDGYPWEATDLFREVYSRRIERGPIRGCYKMCDLLAQYYGRVDDMFADLRKHGFRSDCRLPVLLIGRTGEVFIGNQGNHRLAMAQVLGLSEIAGEVICRHRCLSAA